MRITPPASWSCSRGTESAGGGAMGGAPARQPRPRGPAGDAHSASTARRPPPGHGACSGGRCQGRRAGVRLSPRGLPEEAAGGQGPQEPRVEPPWPRASGSAHTRPGGRPGTASQATWSSGLWALLPRRRHPRQTGLRGGWPPSRRLCSGAPRATGPVRAPRGTAHTGPRPQGANTSCVSSVAHS